MKETSGARRERDTPPSIHHPYGNLRQALRLRGFLRQTF
jgi:hypothetical protein